MTTRFGTLQLLECYCRGAFPMADSRLSPEIYFVIPDIRGIFNLNAVHIPRRLKQQIKQDKFEITVNEAFPTVIEKCAMATDRRPETWINSTIINLYCSLHRDGYAHSVEVWDGNNLVGGIYGIALGSIFFGESMFSTTTNASKIAFMHLVSRLILSGYLILDAQLHNPHLKQFGLRNVTCQEFEVILDECLKNEREFDISKPIYGADVVQIIESASY